jgi:hypothetical protein
MYAVLISVTFNDRSAAVAELEGLVPQVSGMPGFRAGYWVSLSQEKGTSLMVFDSEDSARAMLAMAENAPPTVVSTDNIEVGEVIASA